MVRRPLLRLVLAVRFLRLVRMRRIARRARSIGFLVVAAACAVAPAAVTVDIDLVRLRANPDAAAVAAKLDAALPADAQRKLAALALLTGSDPRRDLTRVVLDLPGDGGGSARLVGLPAARLAALIDLRSAPTPLAGGLSAHPLPRRPELSFVAMADDQALIARTDRVAAVAGARALPPPAASPIAIAFTPGEHPPAALAGVHRATASGDGSGTWTIVAETADDAAAEALAKRVAALQAMVADGAAAGLEKAQRWAPVLAGATIARDGASLRIALTVPREVRDAAIEQLVERIRARAGRG